MTSSTGSLVEVTHPMVREISDSHLRRLIVAKTLFIHGIHHAHLRDQLSRMLSIHHFDNAVEVVLRLLADLSGEKYEENNFNSILTVATRAYQRDTQQSVIPEESEILELHKLRNRIQHGAVVVDSSTGERFGHATESFMSGIIKTLFDSTLTQVSVGGLIDDPALRVLVQSAEKHLEAREFKKCIIKSDHALKMTFVKGITRKAGYLLGYWSVGSSGGDILHRMLDSDKYASRYAGQTRNLAKELAEAIHTLGRTTATTQFLEVYRADVVHHLTRVHDLNKLSPAELADGAVLSLDLATNLILRLQAEGVLVT
jgi:hypothetical protein